MPLSRTRAGINWLVFLSCVHVKRFNKTLIYEGTALKKICFYLIFVWCGVEISCAQCLLFTAGMRVLKMTDNWCLKFLFQNRTDQTGSSEPDICSWSCNSWVTDTEWYPVPPLQMCWLQGLAKKAFEVQPLSLDGKVVLLYCTHFSFCMALIVALIENTDEIGPFLFLLIKQMKKISLK